VPACDGRTNGQTDGFTIANTVFCIASYADALYRKLRYFGHIMRGEDKSLEKGIIEGTCPGIEKEE